MQYPNIFENMSKYKQIEMYPNHESTSNTLQLS